MIFEVQDGAFTYGGSKEILSDLHFTLHEREILAILGPNGVGKTTLLKCMLGLLRWTRGNTLIDGVPIRSMKHNELWKRIGYVPQAKLSSFVYTVLEMVLLGRNAHLGMLEQPDKKDEDIALESLKRVGVLHLRDKLCSKISGGELQLVLVARALTAQPGLLILDEPESNLDFRNQLVVLNILRDLCTEYAISSIVNTHYPEHAMSIANKTILLQKAGPHLYGDTPAIITERNLKHAFGVNVKIDGFSHENMSYTYVMPLSIA
jgi:iron complex transport system ATP-binding protein